MAILFFKMCSKVNEIHVLIVTTALTGWPFDCLLLARYYQHKAI